MFLGLLLWSLVSHAGLPVCQDLWDRVLVELQTIPSTEQNHFIKRVVLPHVGGRLLDSEEGLKPCVHSGACVRLPVSGEGAGRKDLRVQWVSGLEEPQVEYLDTEQVLRLPVGYKFGDETGLMNRWLMGHTYHPQVVDPLARAERLALGEEGILLKDAQRQGILAARSGLARGDRKFLFVAPTSTGKTEVLLSILRSQLENSSKPLHIITADQIHLVQQLQGDVATLGDGFEVMVWGGGQKATSIGELVSQVQAADKPVVLLTTMQSLRKRLDAGGHGELRSVLGTLAYDEVQHVGAKSTLPHIRELIDHPQSEAFFYGTSATPIHRHEDLSQLFGDRLFLAYVDEAEGFSGTQTWKSETILDQFESGMERGEFTPIRGEGIFGMTESRPQGEALLDEVLERVSPVLERNEYGFFAVPNIEQAQALQARLLEAHPGNSFEVYHSQLPPKQQMDLLARARKKEVNYLITVRMMDEGMNLPHLSAYIDLNPTLNPRQYFQRVGRVVRLAPGKHEAEVWTLTPVPWQRLRAALRDHDEDLFHWLLRNGKTKEAKRRKAPNAKGEGSTGFFSDSMSEEEVLQVTGVSRSEFEAMVRGKKRPEALASLEERVKDHVKARDLSAYLKKDEYQQRLDGLPVVLEKLGAYEDYLQRLEHPTLFRRFTHFGKLKKARLKKADRLEGAFLRALEVDAATEPRGLWEVMMEGQDLDSLRSQRRGATLGGHVVKNLWGRLRGQPTQSLSKVRQEYDGSLGQAYREFGMRAQEWMLEARREKRSVTLDRKLTKQAGAGDRGKVVSGEVREGLEKMRVNLERLVD